MTNLCVYIYLGKQVESVVKSPAQDCNTESRALVRLVHLSFKEACTSYESKAVVNVYTLSMAAAGLVLSNAGASGLPHTSRRG